MAARNTQRERQLPPRWQLPGPSAARGSCPQRQRQLPPRQRQRHLPFLRALADSRLKSLAADPDALAFCFLFSRGCCRTCARMQRPSFGPVFFVEGAVESLHGARYHQLHGARSRQFLINPGQIDQEVPLGDSAVRHRLLAARPKVAAGTELLNRSLGA